MIINAKYKGAPSYEHKLHDDHEKAGMVMAEEKAFIIPKSIKLNDLELEPYRYREDSFGDSLIIDMRVVLSEEQYAAIGKMSDFIRVVRVGVDKEPREMKLTEDAWSRNKGKIKEEISLLDKEEGDKKLPPAVWLNNMSAMVAEQNIIINGLIGMLTSKGVLDAEAVKEMKERITRDQIWLERREQNHISQDIDEYKFED